jgi:hypothetical protein
MTTPASGSLASAMPNPVAGALPSAPVPAAAVAPKSETLAIGPTAGNALPPIVPPDHAPSHMGGSSEGEGGQPLVSPVDKNGLSAPSHGVQLTSAFKEPALTPQNSLDPKPGHPATPTVRLVNTRRVTLNYEVKDVGPSGISGVELWYTQDGKNWKKHSSPPRMRPPYIIEVGGEGLYGFTLLAHSGTGMGKEPPRVGDLPQVWVEVDLTPPVVQIANIDAKFANRTPTVTINWKANDKNLGHKPIAISYAEKETGPWQSIATGLENTGQYTWQLPPNSPGRLYVRVEATDLAGNVGSALTPKPVVIDMSQPSVSILAVEPGSK